MANPEHLAKLKEGVAAWNQWREEHPGIIDLSGADFGRADLSGADLSRSNLTDTCFDAANLNEADFEGAFLVRAKLTKANLVEAHLFSANLADADMRETELTWANLFGANLQATKLRGARFTWADLRTANLSQAELEDTNLHGANLSSTNLTGANFRRADLREANLSGAILRNSNLSYARILSTVFDASDLSEVRGLETVEHSGPSVIGIDTIFRSKGNIPEPFLRGCGVPEEFITFAKSLGTNPIEFYSCFISYSTKDQDFADCLYADLQNKGVRCWFAPHDVQGGRKLHEQIDEDIRLHDKLLLILSPHSMESEWVKTEIAKARKREVRDQRRVLFPIRLAPFATLRDWECFDADTGKDSAREIREYFIPDFSHWKDHDSYQEAFQRLIADLKLSDSSSRLTKIK